LPERSDVLPPYPLLVTIGQDDDGLHLVNLEQLCVVALAGDPELGKALARHIAAELALNPWSAIVEVNVIGLGEELAPLDSLRLRHHENGEQESKLLFVGPTAQAIHEAQRRCMVEDVAAILARQFGKGETERDRTVGGKRAPHIAQSDGLRPGPEYVLEHRSRRALERGGNARRSAQEVEGRAYQDNEHNRPDSLEGPYSPHGRAQILPEPQGDAGYQKYGENGGGNAQGNAEEEVELPQVGHDAGEKHTSDESKGPNKQYAADSKSAPRQPM
jgi:hypothetical protein